MPDLSVIICTHTPRKRYLERVLESLRAQSLPHNRWELILVDNASVNPIAGLYDLSWHPCARHVLEPALGLSSARQCGIRVSTGDLLVFVDDDNVLAPNYLSQAVRTATEYGFLGVWGSGSIALEFEVNPDDRRKFLFPWLGLRNVETPIWSNATSCSDATPIGAGICVRRHIGEAYVEFCKTTSIEIAGRKGSSLGGHEDFEICYLACKQGLGMGVFPELKILHLIAKERVTDDYFVKLVHGLTLSKLVLGYKWEGGLPKSPYSVLGAASMALNLLRRRGFDRRIYFAEIRAVVEARRLLSPVGGKVVGLSMGLGQRAESKCISD